MGITRWLILLTLFFLLTACMEAIPPTSGAAQEPAWGTVERQEPGRLPTAIVPPGGFPTRTPVGKP